MRSVHRRSLPVIALAVLVGSAPTAAAEETDAPTSISDTLDLRFEIGLSTIVAVAGAGAIAAGSLQIARNTPQGQRTTAVLCLLAGVGNGIAGGITASSLAQSATSLDYVDPGRTLMTVNNLSVAAASIGIGVANAVRAAQRPARFSIFPYAFRDQA